MLQELAAFVIDKKMKSFTFVDWIYLTYSILFRQYLLKVGHTLFYQKCNLSSSRICIQYILHHFSNADKFVEKRKAFALN